MFSGEQNTNNASPNWRGSLNLQDDQHSGVQKMRLRVRTSEDNRRWEEKMEAPS